MLLVILQGVGFSPRWLEQGDEGERPIDAQALLDGQSAKKLATGIPDARPDYVIQQFDLVASERGRKEWKVIADQAFLYEKAGITHLQTVRAWIYDAKGEATEVTALEGKYTTKGRTIELFGKVDARLPDGFLIQSDYLIHEPEKHTIEIPYPWPVTGDGRQLIQKPGTKPASQSVDQTLVFSSVGARINTDSGRIDLLSQVVVTLDRKDSLHPEQAFAERRSLPGNKPGHGVPDRTLVASDSATVVRTKMEANFKMSERTPLARRFVRVLQPRTYARGRSATLNYGARSNRLHWLELDQDVLIKDRDTGEDEESLYPTPDNKSPQQRPNRTPLNYATAGRAEFDSESDKITLKVFPQAYQDEDTLTGDWMILHRDNDMVEVLHGNAYSTGNE